MSKYLNLPKRVFDSILKAEKKIVTYPIDDKIKRFKEKYQDMKENRELLITDKYGNRYYQYYSHHGLPTKRVVINNMKGFNKWDDDVFMLSWLQRRRINPPTQEELEKLYIQVEELQRKGLEWDRKENAMIEEWKKRQNLAIEKERQETKAIGIGENFEPGTWDRDRKKILIDREKLIESEKENEKEKESDLFKIKIKLTGNELTVQENEIVEIKEEKRIIEGQSTIPGKYMMDFREEDEKWMKRQETKTMKPYTEMASQIDWSKYTFEIMIERGNKETLEKRQDLKDRQQELTNIGKRMLEKKESYQNYNNFRERFKDVFGDR